jgi:hypothetical protein
MPFVGRSGRSRRSGDGGAGAWFAGGIYALKGGSTSEFWRYEATTNTWTEFDSLPPLGSSGNHKVYAGGSLALADSTLFVLKGNRTKESWRYALGSGSSFGVSHSSSGSSPEGVMAAQTALGGWWLAISPNPLASGFATVQLSLPRCRTGASDAKAGSATLEVFDASGRLAHSSFVIRHSEFRLDLRSMPAGVYLVKVTAEGFSTTQKLVVEH